MFFRESHISRQAAIDCVDKEVSVLRHFEDVELFASDGDADWEVVQLGGQDDFKLFLSRRGRFQIPRDRLDLWGNEANE